MDPEQRAILLRLIEQENETPDQRVKRADKSVKFPTIDIAKEAVLGCFLSEGLMELFRSLVHDRYHQTRQPTDIEITFQFTEDLFVNQRTELQIQEMVKTAQMRYSADFVYKSQHSIELSLPRHLDFRSDLCETFVIPDTDPRVSLRGQTGIRAKTFIDMHTVLGVYRGLILEEFVTGQNLLNNPMESWEGSLEEWKVQVQRYLIAMNLDVIDPETGDRLQTMLDLSPLGYSCMASLVNDPRIVVHEPGKLEKYIRAKLLVMKMGHKEVIGKVGNDNVTVQAAYICGFPFPFMVTIQSLLPGQELLYHYGKDNIQNLLR